MKSPTPRDLRLWHHNCQPISIALQIIVLLCWVATPRAEAQGTNSAPVFAEGAATTREVAENTAVGSKIEPAIRATDEDGDELAYTLGGSDAAAFTISQRGRLKTEAPLDYETKSSYTVTVTANDGKGGTASIAVTVNVTRVGSEPPVQQDNSAPVFAEGAATTREVAENTAVGSSIEPAIRARDDDNDELTYTLGGSDAAAFTISQRGRLKTEAPLDYETKSSYTVTVTVDDGKGGAASIAVTVNVTRVGNEPPVQQDNSAPVFAEGAATTREVAENTAVGSSIEPAIRATDEDSDELAYTLGGSDAAAFTISQRGRLKTELPLDYETKSSYTVTVTADDGKGGTASITVTVNVTDVENEPPVQRDNSAPVFAEGAAATREVAENTAVGSNIEPAIRARDDDNDELTYTLGGSDAAAFTISQRGRLKTEAPLDYETKSSYTVTVTVDDGKGGTASIAVTVNVTKGGNTRPASVEEPGVSIWTDALAYLPGDDMKLYLHIDPRMREQQEYAVFVYRTELATGERVWLDLSGETASFLPEAIDIYGQAEQALWSRQLEPRGKQLAWEGEVPEAGHWQFVAELRDGSGTYALKRAYATFVVAAGGTAVVASAGEQRQLQADEQWAGNTIHLLRGRVVVPAGVTLQIEAGAHVLAEAGAAIVVDPQGRIVARGRREKPVVMTCASPIGERVPGCWDGLQISGESTGTGESAGPESSGELRYVRVEFAGGRAEGAAGPAVALHRVSGATVLDHVQAHASLGPGFRFRGGNAACYRCVASNGRQAGILWGENFEGLFQDLYVQHTQPAASAVWGIAGDQPARPRIYNATLVSSRDGPRAESEPGSGIRLDGEQAGLHARNVIATGFQGYGIEVRDGAETGFQDDSLGNLILGLNEMGAVNQPIATYVPEPSPQQVPQFLNVRPEPNPDPRPRNGSRALVADLAAVPPLARSSRSREPHVGAFGYRNWLEQWTWFGGEEQYRATE